MATMVPERRGRPRAEDSRQKLAQVITVARDLFCELGYRAVTMREVAERASVSTRTLYNRYADKLSLFAACLDVGATAFPRIAPGPGETTEQILARHAAEIVRVLSIDTSVRLGVLVYREGADFPEMLRAAEANQHRHLVLPLARYLDQVGLAAPGAERAASLFIAMALSEWQRCVTFRHPMPSAVEIDRHAAFVARTFLHGMVRDHD